MITDNCFLKLFNHNLGKYYNRTLQTILFTLMEPHTKKYEKHFLVKTPWSMGGSYRCFGGTYHLYLKKWHYTEVGITMFLTRTGNHLIGYIWRQPSCCVWSTIYYISAVVTQHINSVALLQLVTFGQMFQPKHVAKCNQL